MPILAIHHVQITVPPECEDAARAFYCGVLGLSEVEKPESLALRGGLWVRAGDRDLHIGVEDGFDRSKTKSHVAYLVDDLDPYRARLAAHHITINESIAIPGFDRFEFRDPFGNRVELIQRTDPSDSRAISR